MSAYGKWPQIYMSDIQEIKLKNLIICDKEIGTLNSVLIPSLFTSMKTSAANQNMHILLSTYRYRSNNNKY